MKKILLIMLAMTVVLGIGVGWRVQEARADLACGDGVDCPEGNVVAYDQYINCEESRDNPGTCTWDTEPVTAACIEYEREINGTTYGYCHLGVPMLGVRDYQCEWLNYLEDGVPTWGCLANPESWVRYGCCPGGGGSSGGGSSGGCESPNQAYACDSSRTNSLFARVYDFEEQTVCDNNYFTPVDSEAFCGGSCDWTVQTWTGYIDIPADGGYSFQVFDQNEGGTHLKIGMVQGGDGWFTPVESYYAPGEPGSVDDYYIEGGDATNWIGAATINYVCDDGSVENDVGGKLWNAQVC